jgi:hypothetical protein
MKEHETRDSLEWIRTSKGRQAVSLAVLVESLGFRELAIQLIGLAYAAFDEAV